MNGAINDNVSLLAITDIESSFVYVVDICRRDVEFFNYVVVG